MAKLLDDLVSLCCNAPVEIAGRTTHYFVCTKCGIACDAKTKIDKRRN